MIFIAFSPKEFHPIVRKNLLGSNKSQLIRKGLGDQQTIKGVAMVKRQLLDLCYVTQLNVQQFKIVGS
jgi:hypothetical protein